MTNIFSRFMIIVAIILAGIGGYFLGNKKDIVSPNQTATTSSQQIKEKSKVPEQNNSTKTNIFKFHNFHGEDLGTAGFEFEIPAGWHNDGQYFSPQPINHYDIISTDAPAYYDLVSEDLINTSDLKYQITQDKRYKPDSEIVISGANFKKYDLIDYQNKSRVIIFVGPKINIFESGYYIVFRWEEKPLGLDILNNSPVTFEKMVTSLKFTK